MDAARQAPGIILGPVDHLQYPSREQGGINPSGELRVKLDLFANIRPAKSRMGVGLTGKPVDLVIFRECTEGFYADRNMLAISSPNPPREPPTSAASSAPGRFGKQVRPARVGIRRATARRIPKCCNSKSYRTARN